MLLASPVMMETLVPPETTDKREVLESMPVPANSSTPIHNSAVARLFLDQQDQPVHLDHLEALETKDPSVCLVPLDQLVHPVPLELLELLEMLDHLANLVPLDNCCLPQLPHKEDLVPLVNLDQLEALDSLEALETVDALADPELKELPASLVPLDAMETPDNLVLLDSLVPLDLATIVLQPVWPLDTKRKHKENFQQQGFLSKRIQPFISDFGFGTAKTIALGTIMFCSFKCNVFL